METQNKPVITVETIVNAPVAKVWEYWTKPEHIKKWNNASDDWHTPHAENDLLKAVAFLAGWKQKMAVLVLTLVVFTMQCAITNTLNIPLAIAEK